LLSGELNLDASEYQIRIKVENKVEPQPVVVDPKRKGKEVKPKPMEDKFYITNQDRFLI